MDMMSRFLREQAGATTTITAVALVPVLIVMAVCANLTLVYLDKQESQSRLDLAALYLVSRPNADLASAHSVLEEDGILVKPGDLSFQKGIYRDDPNVPMDARFTPNDKDWNAVKLTALTDIDSRVYGSKVKSDNQFASFSIAARRVETDFWMGSRLLRVEDGLLGAVLKAGLGYDGRIDVADYRRLVGVDANMIDILRALNLSASLSAVTYEDVLTSDITLSQFQTALNLVSGGSFLKTSLRAPDPVLNRTLKLSEIIDLGAVGGLPISVDPDEGNFLVSAGDLLLAGLLLANGENQIALSVEGLSGLTELNLKVGEKGVLGRWHFGGDVEDKVTTEQVALELSVLGSLLKVELDLASATGWVDQALCDGERTPKKADIRVITSAAELRLVSSAGTLLKLDLSDEKAEKLSFNAADIRDGTIKTTRSSLSVDINDAPILYRPLVRQLDGIIEDLGLHIGEADVRVTNVTCTRPYLVR